MFVDFFCKKSFFAENRASDRVKDATGNAALSKILAENEFFSVFDFSRLRFGLGRTDVVVAGLRAPGAKIERRWPVRLGENLGRGIAATPLQQKSRPRAGGERGERVREREREGALGAVVTRRSSAASPLRLKLRGKTLFSSLHSTHFVLCSLSLLHARTRTHTHSLSLTLSL